METSAEVGDIEHIDIEDCVESCSGVKLDILKLIVIYFVYSAIYKVLLSSINFYLLPLYCWYFIIG